MKNKEKFEIDKIIIMAKRIELRFLNTDALDEFVEFLGKEAE